MEIDKFLAICPEEPEVLIDWEGIKYNPDTTVSMKVIYSLERKIVELLSAGFHSISVSKGKRGFPRVNYRMAGFPTIWEELGEELDYSADEIRGYIVSGSKEAAKHEMKLKLGIQYTKSKEIRKKDVFKVKEMCEGCSMCILVTETFCNTSRLDPKDYYYACLAGENECLAKEGAEND